MAERLEKATKRPARKARASPRPLPISDAKGATGQLSSDPRLAALQAECDRLRAELAVARTRISDLETQRRLAVDRIDWVIDSLHSLKNA